MKLKAYAVRVEEVHRMLRRIVMRGRSQKRDAVITQSINAGLKITPRANLKGNMLNPCRGICISLSGGRKWYLEECDRASVFQFQKNMDVRAVFLSGPDYVV